MVTMDAQQGIKLLCALEPDHAIPIQYIFIGTHHKHGLTDDIDSIDDYDVFESPLSDFQNAVREEGWEDRVVYLKRGDEFMF